MPQIPWRKSLSILLATGLFGLALAQNPTSGAPEGFLDGVFSTIFSQSVTDAAEEWRAFIGGLISAGISRIALVLLAIALLYRIYDIWLSELSSTAFLYTLVRYAFIVGFFTISNVYIARGLNAGYEGAPLKGYSSACGDIVFSKVALCAWETAEKEGKRRITGLQTRLERAITQFVKATVTAITGLGFIKLMKTALTQSMKHLKPKTSKTPQPTSGGGGGGEGTGPVQKETPDLASTLMRWMNLLPFLAYLLLALPAIIYGFLVIVSSVSLVIAIAFIPLAIALMAWGYVQPIFRVGLFILGQVLFIYILPTIFILAVVFALERPAAMMEGISRQIDAAIDNIFTQLTSSTVSFDDGFDQQVQSNPSFFDYMAHPEKILDKAGEMMQNFFQALVSIVGSLLMIIVLQMLAFIFFLASLLISFGAAFALINAVPSLLIEILQGGGGQVRGASPGMGTGMLQGPVRTRL